MKLSALIPLLLFILLLMVLGIGLTLDPSKVESPLIGKPLPPFTLPILSSDSETRDSAALKGHASLLNVWASWCFACKQEHEMLLAIARQGLIPIYGFNYKDTRQDAGRWLAKLGDPYQFNFFDADGRAGIELGVYGAPETFVIDRHGVIVHKQIGPITPEVWQQTLLPLITKLQGAP